MCRGKGKLRTKINISSLLMHDSSFIQIYLAFSTPHGLSFNLEQILQSSSAQLFLSYDLIEHGDNWKMCEINYIYRNIGNDRRTDRQIYAKSICEIHIICQCTMHHKAIHLISGSLYSNGCLLMRGTIWHKMFWNEMLLKLAHGRVVANGD